MRSRRRKGAAGEKAPQRIVETAAMQARRDLKEIRKVITLDVSVLCWQMALRSNI